MSTIDKDSLAPQLLQLICKGIARKRYDRYMPQGEVLEHCLTVLACAEKEVLAHLVRQSREDNATADANLAIAKAQAKL